MANTMDLRGVPGRLKLPRAVKVTPVSRDTIRFIQSLTHVMLGELPSGFAARIPARGAGMSFDVGS